MNSSYPIDRPRPTPSPQCEDDAIDLGDWDGISWILYGCDLGA